MVRGAAVPLNRGERLTLAALTALAVVLAGRLIVVKAGVFGRSVSRTALVIRPLPVVPYTVVLDEDIVDPFGRHHQGGRYTTAVRGDGSYVRAMEALGVTGVNQQLSRRTVFLASGLRVATDDIRERKTTTLEVPPRVFLRDPGLECRLAYSSPLPGTGEAVESTGEFIAGFRVVRIRGRGWDRAWYAPELGCALLKGVIVINGSTTTQVASLAAAGEPDPALFEVERLTEVPPSVRLNIQDPATAAAQDEQYFAKRKRQ